MARDHFIVPTVGALTGAVRLGAGNSSTADNLTFTEQNKFCKLAGESRYDLAVVGDEIDGQIYAIENALQNGFTIGSVQRGGVLFVTADGLQASPGSGGSLAIGDIVLVGTPVAKGTALGNAYPKVVKATTPANVIQKWRVVSLGTVGTGAVGTVCAIERLHPAWN